MKTPEAIKQLIEKAVAQAVKAGVSVTLEYIDKSVIYDESGEMEERRDIEVRIKASPQQGTMGTVEIQPAAAYAFRGTEPEG